MLLREAIAYDGKDDATANEILQLCEERGIASDDEVLYYNDADEAVTTRELCYVEYDDYAQVRNGGEALFTTWCEGEERIVKEGERE